MPTQLDSAYSPGPYLQDLLFSDKVGQHNQVGSWKFGARNTQTNVLWPENLAVSETKRSVTSRG